jgi:hypothetical protein
MRKAVLAAGIAALLVLLYTGAGYWLAPRFVLDALQKRAAELGATLTVEELRTDPFAFAVDLSGVELVGADGRRLAAARNLHVDLAWASLWGDAWSIERATLAAPYGEIVLGPNGAVNWPVTRAKGKTEEKTVKVRVQAFRVTEGTLHFVDRSRTPVELTLQALSVHLQNLANEPGSEAQYELAGREVGGGTVASQGTFSLDPLAAHGKVSVAAAALKKVWQLAAPSAEPAQGQLSAHAVYAYEEGRLVLRDVSLHGAPVAYSGIELEEISVEAPRIAVPLEEPVALTARAQLKTAGSLSAQGTVDPRPLAIRLKLEAEAIPLALAQRFLPDSAAAKIASGSVSGKGTLHVRDKGLAYEGTAAVREMRLEERDSRNLLLGWQLARTDALKVSSAPYSVEIGELAVQAPEGRLIIEEDGSVNFAEALRGERGKEGKAFHAALRRLRIENGTLQFADRSLDTPFQATIRELSGTVTGFSTEAGDPALVQLAGRVEKYGSARIRGTIDLDEPKSRADIRASFRNLDLAQLTPYVVKFAGYHVRSGRLSADLRYQVREGRLVGQNQLVFQRLQLGEKVERAGAADLPLELAVALLADPQGRINLDIPVRGDLNEPQFDFGGLVARALRNVIGKIVSAPFRALATVFGGRGKELDQIRFAPGSAQLAPPQEESVAQVAKALAERPQLAVRVRGGYDPERDPGALRVQVVRREILKRAGYKAEGPLDFSDPKVLHAAENLYLERVGNRLELQALRDREAQYGRALIDQLAAVKTVDPTTAETLARARAEMVRAALLEHGVEPSRVALEPPAAEAAEKEGVPTQLSLTTESPRGEASVGGSRR